MFKKILKYLFATLILIGLIIASIIHVFGNFYKVDKGIYRSGQLNRYNLEYYIKKYKFKTILNLRGESKSDKYKNEIALAKRYNITHINHKLSNRIFYDYKQTSQLVLLLKQVQKPLLIHCIGGADRTSLASALYLYGVAGKNEKTAKEEFSFFYGHIPFFRPKVLAMDRSFENYVKHHKKNRLDK